MTKAPAPMTGGINWPPVEAAASTPPANFGGKPARFISGMVMTPVETVLATADPVIDPMRPEPRIATIPGPPVMRPAAARASARMKSPAPERTRNAPSRMNMNTKVQEMRAIGPNIPSVPK